MTLAEKQAVLLLMCRFVYQRAQPAGDVRRGPRGCGAARLRRCAALREAPPPRARHVHAGEISRPRVTSRRAEVGTLSYLIILFVRNSNL